MSDEILYLQATNEVDGEERDLALWAKVMALVEGDQRKAKYKYIKLRVEQITNVKIKDKPIHAKKTGDEVDDKYIPVEEFSIIKSIPVKKVVEMIRGGFYMGQLKDSGWFVSREDVGNEKQQAWIKPNNISTKKILDKEYISIEEFSEYKGITRDKTVEMIKDGFYQGRIIDDKWYVAYSELENNHTSTQYCSDSTLSKLISGDYSLPKTYWLFGVLGDFSFYIFVTIALASGSTAVLFLVMPAVIYALVVAVGIWRSSDKYQGLKVWAVLAKIAVVLRILGVLLGLASLGTIVSA